LETDLERLGRMRRTNETNMKDLMEAMQIANRIGDQESYKWARYEYKLNESMKERVEELMRKVKRSVLVP